MKGTALEHPRLKNGFQRNGRAGMGKSYDRAVLLMHPASDPGSLRIVCKMAPSLGTVFFQPRLFECAAPSQKAGGHSYRRLKNALQI